MPSSGASAIHAGPRFSVNHSSSTPPIAPIDAADRAEVGAPSIRSTPSSSRNSDAEARLEVDRERRAEVGEPDHRGDARRACRGTARPTWPRAIPCRRGLALVGQREARCSASRPQAGIEPAQRLRSRGAGLPLAAIQRADSGIVNSSDERQQPASSRRRRRTRLPSRSSGASQLVTCPASAPPALKPSMMIVTARRLLARRASIRC